MKNKVFKSIVLLIMILSIINTSVAFAGHFSDVKDNSIYSQAINELYALGIVNGYEDGSFLPAEKIVRAEVTKMIVAAMGPDYAYGAVGASKTDTGFSDVPVSHWASGYILTGVANGFINGMGDGTFAPEAYITFEQIVKMLVSAIGYSQKAEEVGGYPYGYIRVGSSIGICDGVYTVHSDDYVTREQVAQLINNTLNTPYVAVLEVRELADGSLKAVTRVQDGDGELDRHQTLLTENHKVYRIKGRIKNIYEQNNILFSVEYTDNFDGKRIAAGQGKRNYDNNALDVQLQFKGIVPGDYFGMDTEALVKKGNDGKWTLICITAK